MKTYIIVIEQGPMIQANDDSQALEVAFEVLKYNHSLNRDLHSIAVRAIDPDPIWLSKQVVIKAGE